MNFVLKHKTTLLGMLIGAIGGYSYYYFVGCASGSCAITSRPLNITAYGALMGALLFTSLKKEDTNTKINDDEKQQNNH